MSAHGVSKRIASADHIGRTVGLDMARAGWQPTVANYLGRVTKPRILEAVREARGEEMVGLIDHLKKGDMAKEAERLLDGSGSGTEVALLIRRLRNRLGLSPDRMQVIATSASFSDGDAARRFIGGLVGREVEKIEVLRGTKHARLPSGSGDAALAVALAACRTESLKDTGRAQIHISGIQYL